MKQPALFREQMQPTKVPFSMNDMDLEQLRKDNLEQPPKEKPYSRDPNEEQFYFTDRRTTHPVTGAPINPNRDLKSGRYSTKVVRSIIKYAKEFKQDPNRALAYGMQESNLGASDQNIGHVNDREIFEDQNILDKDDYEAKQMVYAMKKNNEWNEDYFKKTHKISDDQFNKYPIDTWRIQAYNGLGIVNEDTEAEYLDRTNRKGQFRYGIDVTKTPLNMKENPAYAKTILSLEDQIKNDPDFQRLINETLSNEEKLIKFINEK
ncbi:MAG: hypothetical protein JXR64_02600 [Spirochaetales bacterium]|nr:hypothetical protein [Spirochaetales bacterium]